MTREFSPAENGSMVGDAINTQRIATLEQQRDAQAETIAAIAALCTYRHESKEDFIGRVRAVLGDDPDARVSSVRARLVQVEKEQDALLAAQWVIARGSALLAIEKCKNATGQRRTIDLYVSANQCAEDVLEVVRGSNGIPSEPVESEGGEL